MRMMMILCFLGLLGTLNAERALIDGVAAHVNENSITVGEVAALVQPEYSRLVYKYNGPELERELAKAYKSALDTLIERSLILDAYEKQEAKLPDWIIDNRISEIINDSFKGDKQVLMQALAKDNLSYDEWKDQIRERIIISSMRSSNLDFYSDVPPAAVRKYYKSHMEKFKTGGEVLLRMIRIGKGAGAEAAVQKEKLETVIKRLADGADFADLAREYSEGDRASDGGSWGWVDPGILRSEIAEALKTLPAGKVSDVVEVEREWYILRIDDKKAEKHMSMDEAQDLIVRALKKERADRMYGEWVERLKKNAYVMVFEFDAKIQ